MTWPFYIPKLRRWNTMVKPWWNPCGPSDAAGHFEGPGAPHGWTSRRSRGPKLDVKSRFFATKSRFNQHMFRRNLDLGNTIFRISLQQRMGVTRQLFKVDLTLGFSHQKMGFSEQDLGLSSRTMEFHQMIQPLSGFTTQAYGSNGLTTELPWASRHCSSLRWPEPRGVPGSSPQPPAAPSRFRPSWRRHVSAGSSERSKPRCTSKLDPQAAWWNWWNGWNVSFWVKASKKYPIWNI